MTMTDIRCLLPLLIISGAANVLMLVIALRRNFTISYIFTLLGFLAAFISIFFILPDIPHQTGKLLTFDHFSMFFSGIIILMCLLIALLSNSFLKNLEGEKEEYLIILFVAALGSLILVSASNFVTLFLGLEMLSISLFILIAYRRSKNRSVEASVKYLVLASVSSAFLLFGMGLIYADTGSLEFSAIGTVIQGPGHSRLLMLTGFGMILVGIGFKLALVPFHMWTPDVYQGAPVPVTTFIATISKGAIMALFIRFFFALKGYNDPGFSAIITSLAVLSMLIGNLLAIRQDNVKRILAYSSIANMGYLLVTLLIGAGNGAGVAVFYLVSYMVTTVAAFGVISVLSGKALDIESIEGYRGLFWKKPWIATVFTLALLSLAGIPLTAGFMAKFYLVFAGVQMHLWVLVISLIVTSVIGLYYYLRIITAMFSSANELVFPEVPFTGHIVLGVVSLVILWLGIFPGWIIDLISRFATIL